MGEATLAIIAEKRPGKAELKAGETYFWCRCGHSANAKNQPTTPNSSRRI
jgi:CDGSH-type Zn-finger protein